MTSRTFLLACTIAVLLLALPAAASADVRHASPTGSGDEAVCSQAVPCSLADALLITELADGDEVVLAPGSYNVDASGIGVIAAADIHGSGLPGATVIETIGSPNGFNLNNPGAKLRDVEIHHSNGNGSGVHVIKGALERVIARSSSGNGCGVIQATVTDSICVTTATGYAGLSYNEGGTGTDTTELRNVTAIGAGEPSSNGIFVLADETKTAVVNGVSVIARGSGDDVRAVGMSPTATATVTFSNSNFGEATVGGPGSTSVPNPATGNNQSAAPLFVDAPGGDYHQAAGSPTIDAGAVDGTSGSSDIDGQVRPNGTNDIGADEYYAPLVPAPGPGPGATPDTDRPAGKILKGPRARTRSRRASFKFSSDESGSSYLCKLDRGAYKPCKRTWKKRVKLGRHTLRMVAVDAAGNKDASPAVWRWRVIR